jgi:hypothetical protein
MSNKKWFSVAVLREMFSPDIQGRGAVEKQNLTKPGNRAERWCRMGIYTDAARKHKRVWVFPGGMSITIFQKKSVLPVLNWTGGKPSNISRHDAARAIFMYRSAVRTMRSVV